MTNSRGGCAGMLAAGALGAAARVVDGVMGPPEDDATFARITDRCSLPAHVLYASCMLGVGAGLLRPGGQATVWLIGARRGQASLAWAPVPLGSTLHARKHEA